MNIDLHHFIKHIPRHSHQGQSIDCIFMVLNSACISHLIRRPLARCISYRSYGKLAMGSPKQQNEDLFNYTSGRWLWNEEEQLLKRRRRFKVDELKSVAAKSVGASSCVSIIKIGEGGYNRVFRLEMDNGSVAIARIPSFSSDLACRAIASEVATMELVSSRSHSFLAESNQAHNYGICHARQGLF